MLKDYKLIVLYDTREKANAHILNQLAKNGVECRRETFKYGDYSFILKNLITGEEISFKDKYVIERKKNLDELAQNLGKKREQFTNEFKRCAEVGAKMDIIIEDANWYYNIITHNYRSKFNSKAFKNSLMAFEAQYNVNIFGTNKLSFASYIYTKFLYKAKSYIFSKA